MIEIWDLKLDSLFWFCASGKVFFVGIALLAVSLLPVVCFKNKGGRLSSIILAVLSIVLIWLSSTPCFSFWWWIWIVGFGFWYVMEIFADNISVKISWSVRILLALICLLPGALEYRYWSCPSISLQNINTIYVIGDSVSSGIGGPDEKTWPKILSGGLKIPVVNLAIAGATAESALRRQTPLVKESSGIVFVEIGGNDILNSTKPDVFEKSMRQMFGKLKTTANRIVWFELPLLPGKTEYGRIQRKLAGEMKITLVPKRFLSEVFQTPQATSDAIHLTAKGHQLFAQEVYQLFKVRGTK